MSTKTNYIGYKLITNIKKGDLSGCFLPSKISDLAYSKETLVSSNQESRREGWTDARSAVGFCLGSGLFGSYYSD